jgi:hypothetical protein
MTSGKFDRLETDLEGKKVDVSRKRTNILFSVDLEQRLREVYPDQSLGSVLEESALQRLRREGHIQPKPLPDPGESVKTSRKATRPPQALQPEVTSPYTEKKKIVRVSLKKR